jgi:hypothetical protein
MAPNGRAMLNGQKPKNVEINRSVVGMTLEELMKSKLDGTFTKFTSEGRVKTIDVEVEYIPKKCRGWKNQYRDRSERIAWTQADDDFLLTLREQKTAIKYIAYKMDRTPSSVKNRLEILRRAVRAA